MTTDPSCHYPLRYGNIIFYSFVPNFITATSCAIRAEGHARSLIKLLDYDCRFMFFLFALDRYMRNAWE